MLLTVKEYAEKHGIPKHTINTAIYKGLIVPKKKEKNKFFLEDKPYEARKEQHGLSRDPAYAVWSRMKNRCYNTKGRVYKYYGGKGITICDEWQDVGTFIKWLYSQGWKDKSGFAIDRIDPEKGYSPDNCRVISAKENSIRALEELWSKHK